MEDLKRTIAKILDEDKKGISYRPSWKQVTGSVNATILLQQVRWRWQRKEHKPFFKFFAPPKTDHKAYKAGDSWVEELGFTLSELQGAIKKIGKRLTKAEVEDLSNSLDGVFFGYFRDQQHLTWFYWNEDYFLERMMEVYVASPDEKSPSGKSPSGNSSSPQMANSNLAKSEFPISILTETPTDTTTDNKKDSNPNGQKPPVSDKQKASRAMFAAVCKVCQIDWQVATDDIKGKVNQTESVLRKAGRKPKDLDRFADWWREHKPWKYRNFDVPEPHHLRSVMGQYMTWLKGQLEIVVVEPADLPATPPPPDDPELQQIRAIAGPQFQFLELATQQKRSNGHLVLEFPVSVFEMAQHRKERVLERLAGWMAEENLKIDFKPVA